MPITQNPSVDLGSRTTQLYYLGDGAAIFGCVGNPNGVIQANKRSFAIDENGNIYTKGTDNSASGWNPYYAMMPGFIDPVKEFGITGSGDETTKLQNAINSAASTGRILLLPAFAITVSQVVIPDRGVQIQGQLGTNGKPSSVIQSTGANQAIILLGNTLTRSVRLKDFMIQGTASGANQHGISSTNFGTSLFEMRNLIVQFCGGDGIHITTQAYSYVLENIYSSFNNGSQFFIDAVNAPCIGLYNCYAGVVATNGYGFYISRGVVEMFNCNSLDGGTPPHSCVRVGDSAIGSAVVTLRNCNFESFGLYGIFVDVASDVRLFNCSFVAPGVGTVQPLYMIQPSGRSFIDAATTFISGGATYNNPANLPIVIYSRWLDAPSGINPISSTRVLTYWNSEDGRVEALANLASRYAVNAITANYTETRPTANYIGVNAGGAVTVNLLDPASNECPTGRPVVIKDESGNAAANNITVRTVNNRNIDGAASAVISTNYGSLHLVQRNGQYWKI